MYLWVQCVWFPVMISTFLLMFLHQMFYKSAIVMENKHASDGTVCAGDAHFTAQCFTFASRVALTARIKIHCPLW